MQDYVPPVQLLDLNGQQLNYYTCTEGASLTLILKINNPQNQSLQATLTWGSSISGHDIESNLSAQELAEAQTLTGLVVTSPTLDVPGFSYVNVDVVSQPGGVKLRFWLCVWHGEYRMIFSLMQYIMQYISPLQSAFWTAIGILACLQ